MTKRKRVVNIIKYNVIVIVILLFVTFLGSKTITTVVENLPSANPVKVVIDPGHGGVDGGATSCTGVLESNINLEISLRLDDLMHLLGIHTKMIRKTDISVYTEGESIAAKKVSDLKNRVQEVNKLQNAVLLSIHQNYFADNRYSGAQVFYASTSGSDLLAKNMQKAFIDTLNLGGKRQAKKASGVYLMEKINCTGVLVECGFLSNPQEEEKLRDANYQKKICCVIVAETSKYLSAYGCA